MAFPTRRSRATLLAWVVVSLLVAPALAPAQGVALRGVGSINESMGSAAVAAPLDAAGAIHWNPASIVALERSEAWMGLNLLQPDLEVQSSLPQFGLGGSTRSESGPCPIPSMAIVHRGCAPSVAFGVGAYGIAGFKVNYDADPTNPILAPQGSLGLIPTLGRVASELQIMQVAPTMAVALTDQFSIGVAPTLSLATAELEPLVVASPFPAGFPTASSSRYTFGGGFQVGAYYVFDSAWRFGASYKSKQWFEPFRFKSQDAAGLPQRTDFELDYPSIVSVGTGYYGLPRTVLALDVRYFDYENADGFGTSGFNPDGSVAGLGWSSILAVSTGAQYQLTDRLIIRGGYTFNQNPIASDDVVFNIPAPLVVQHVLALGFTCQLSQSLSTSVTYSHAFEGSQSGSYLGLPGSDVTIRTLAYALSTGVTLHY